MEYFNMRTVKKQDYLGKIPKKGIILNEENWARILRYKRTPEEDKSKMKILIEEGRGETRVRHFDDIEKISVFIKFNLIFQDVDVAEEKNEKYGKLVKYEKGEKTLKPKESLEKKRIIMEAIKLAYEERQTSRIILSGAALSSVCVNQYFIILL